MSPYESMPLIHPSRGFADETLRQIVRVRGSGEQLRIRLTNRFGRQPLTVGRTRVAAHRAGSTIVPGTDRAVTFAGAAHVVIPEGAEVVSDVVEFATTDETDLVLSTYHPVPTGLATYHPFTLQTGYVAPGDVTADPTLPAAVPVEPRFHLGGIDVLAAEPRRVVAVFGDSLTDGVGTTPGAHLRYPDLLGRRIGAATVLNLGIAGNRLLADVFGERGVARFDRDVLELPGLDRVIVQIGLNDIGLATMFDTPAVSAADLIAGPTSIARRAGARGVGTIATTVTPFGGAAGLAPGLDTPENEETRQRVNDWIRTTHEFDAYADLDHALRDPAAPTALRPEYDSGDHIHPNDAGAEAMAAATAEAPPRNRPLAGSGPARRGVGGPAGWRAGRGPDVCSS
ncbi:GDSL-type esterase/lipase family protein [Embleya sp. AB8]|uniref:GDSL-type esterase/lipase family protein n=1 Tax=Embleya sp. AB8 TaxID=3156304 RepID=UPI003C71DD47